MYKDDLGSKSSVVLLENCLDRLNILNKSNGVFLFPLNKKEGVSAHTKNTLNYEKD